MNAVLGSGCGTLADVEERLTALATVRPTENFEPLAVSFKRIGNILKQADFRPSQPVQEELLEPGPERQFYTQYSQIPSTADGASYLDTLRGTATLRPTVDLFFEKVLVNVEDEKVRANRLTLLHDFLTKTSTIADFSKIVTSGDEKK